MMTSLLIDFTEHPPKLTFDKKTAGFKAVAQNCLVNLATTQTDRLYPDRGTNLVKDAGSGKLIDLNSSQHSANFAAGDTLYFQRSLQAPGDAAGLASVTLTPVEFDGESLNLNAVFTSISGEVVGISAVV